LYQSSDFDISGLSDSQNLRETWSGKQDALSAGTGIIIDSNNVISVNESEIAEIDDTVTETGKTWSSFKFSSELDSKSNTGHTHQMSEVSGLTGTIDKIENELSEHQGTISGIVEDIADMAATLLDHENRIEELSARTYSAGSHILIDSANTISALYQSSDFDISGLTDSQNLRETWSGKQDALSAGTGIIIDANNVISVNEEEIAEIDDTVTETGKTWSSFKISSELDNKSNTGHTHTISDVTGLQNLLDGKSDTGHTHEQYSLTSHTHTISDISGLTEELNNKSNTGHTHDDYVLKSVFESSTYAFSSHINELTERVDADDAIQNITVEDVIDELNIIDNN
jgi:23S rRNA pseudoU1915 N3-methylase RlmH